MVRLGGLDYTMAPKAGFGKRVTDMVLDDGSKIEANKMYTVAGWATVGSKAPGAPIWEVVAEYLRSEKVAKVKKLNTPKIVGMEGNPGIA